MKEALLSGGGFLLTVVVIPWVRRFSFNIGYLDQSEGDPLKIHGLPVPHSGGIAIFGVFGLLMILLTLTGQVEGRLVAGLLVGGSVAFGLGVWDDLKPTTPGIRLAGAIMAGIVLILFGSRVEAPLLLSLPLTLFYVLGAINAINLQDGLDGLAGGMVALSCLGFAFLSSSTGQTVMLTISFLLGGVLLGFLFFNSSPASIFMGDSGSYFLGFVQAYLAISFSNLQHWTNFLGPILIIGVPVLDTFFTILRRLKKGVSPFTGDRSHFYDFLVGKGLTVRQTVVISYGIQAVLISFGVGLYTSFH